VFNSNESIPENPLICFFAISYPLWEGRPGKYIFLTLEFFCKNHLGVKLAEFDLKSRGAGNIFGTEQHGFVNLKIASLTDFELIDKTKKAVEYFVKNHKIEDYPDLEVVVEKFKVRRISKD